MPVIPALASETAPAASPSVIALISALDDLARVQRESATRIARDLDLPRAAFGMLRMLDRCGSVQVSDIAAMLRVDLSVASRHVSHLVDDGLARRTVDDDDRRARTVELTQAGRDVMRRSDEIVNRLSSDVFASWTDDEIDEAARQVARVTASVADGLTAPPTPTAPADPASSKEHHTA